MTTEQLNQLINILASVTLFEMMVTIGLGVTFAELSTVAKDRRLVARAAVAIDMIVVRAIMRGSRVKIERSAISRHILVSSF